MPDGKVSTEPNLRRSPMVGPLAWEPHYIGSLGRICREVWGCHAELRVSTPLSLQISFEAFDGRCAM